MFLSIYILWFRNERREEGEPMFQRMTLPYDETALEPHISARTLQFHHGKHHKKYVDTLNELVEGTDLAGLALEEVVRLSHGRSEMQAVFNNAGQSWNHDFFWTSMKPDANPPTLAIQEFLERDFGGIDGFREAFKKAGVGQFGSGWVWLVLTPENRLQVMSTANADSPLVHDGLEPLLTCDVWEHAYYLDYQNRRPDFLDAFVDHLINWDQVAALIQRRGAALEAPASA